MGGGAREVRAEVQFVARGIVGAGDGVCGSSVRRGGSIGKTGISSSTYEHSRGTSSTCKDVQSYTGTY